MPPFWTAKLLTVYLFCCVSWKQVFIFVYDLMKKYRDKWSFVAATSLLQKSNKFAPNCWAVQFICSCELLPCKMRRTLLIDIHLINMQCSPALPKRSEIKFSYGLTHFASFPYQRLHNSSQSTVAIDFNQAISEGMGGAVMMWMEFKHSPRLRQ